LTAFNGHYLREQSDTPDDYVKSRLSLLDEQELISQGAYASLLDAKKDASRT